MTSRHFSHAVLPSAASASLPSLQGVLWKPITPHGTHSHFSEKKAVATETGK